MNRPNLHQVLTVLCLASSLTVLAPGVLRAQFDNGRVFLSYGHIQLDMSKFNNRLLDRNMVEFETSFNTLGAGFYSFINDRWCLGGELQFLLENTRPVGVYETAVSGTNGGINLGYTAYRLGGFTVRPQLGLSGGSINLDIKALSMPSSGSPLGNGRDRVELSSVQAALSLMLAMDYLWVMRQTEEGTGYGLMLGMQIGYQLSPWQSDWKSSGIEIFDDPGIKYQGPRLLFSAGFGWGME